VLTAWLRWWGESDVIRRLRWGIKYTVLSHNTIRGAAGNAILTAELLAAKGFL